MLEVEGLRVSYKKVNAVRDVTLRVGEGEIVALIGANGAGKTTTLKAISGLLQPKGGEVRYNGQVMNGKTASQIVGAGIVQVPEGRQVFSGMTVEENLILGGFLVQNKALRRERMEAVYDLFPILRERYHQKAGNLSGGEQQMLAIGRAIVSGPRLLLLDEPSLGLAPLMVEQVFDVIGQLRETGISILLVEQNANEALRVSDRSYIMETGQIVLSGSSQEIAGNTDVQRIYLGGGA